jgi:hypothetical protein
MAGAFAVSGPKNQAATARVSKAWKFSASRFQALEKYAVKFSKPWKLRQE